MANPQAADFKIYRRLLAEAKPYWLLIAGTFVMDSVSIPLALLSPIPMQMVVDHVLGTKPLAPFAENIFSVVSSPTKDAVLIGAIILIITVALFRQLQGLAS